MSTLTEREKYSLGLILVNGGQSSYYAIRDIILESKESFGDLSEDYLKYQAIKRVLNRLKEKRYLTEKDEVYTVNPIMESGFIQNFPIVILKALKNYIKYRSEHILEFDTSEIEDILLKEDEEDSYSVYYLRDNLKDALKLHRMGSYDSVLVKCGKCVELVVEELNEQYELFEHELTTGNMLIQLRNDKIMSKIQEARALAVEDFRTLVDGMNVVHRFRNIMGAHAGSTYGQDQVATSCLILTLYLVDLYIWSVRKD